MKKSLLTIFSFSVIALGVKAQTQLPNIGYETWETLNGPISNTYQEPVDWNTSNECTAIVNQFSVSKSSDAHSGSFSARLETKSTSFPGVIANGVITTAQMICLAQGGGQEGGMAYTDQLPDSLVGWYKYTPVNMDSAYAQLMFLANNEMDTVSMTRINFHAAAEWTRFAVAVTSASSSPELLSLIFNSSWGDGSQGQAIVGSVFFIDDVELVFPFDIGVGDGPDANGWTVYPNPVQGELRVDVRPGQQAEIEILDVTGKLVKRAKLNDDNTSVDLSALVAGIYLYQITSSDERILRTGKLLVNP